MYDWLRKRSKTLIFDANFFLMYDALGGLPLDIKCARLQQKWSFLRK